MTRVNKRDHCLWLKHLAGVPGRHLLDSLSEGETVEIFIDGQPTWWGRMRSYRLHGETVRTDGLKLLDGKEVWEPIPIGDQFEIEILKRTAEPASGKKDHARTEPVQCKGAPAVVAIADYSGASSRRGQRKNIKLATTTVATGIAGGVPETFTRSSLTEWTFGFLKDATRTGVRSIVGWDFQLSFPMAFFNELAIPTTSWRASLQHLVKGGYGPEKDGPSLSGPSQFCADLNRWLEKMGKRSFYYSATQPGYGLPSHDPRREDRSTYRLCERVQANRDHHAKPKPFHRVGDNGSVGNQTLLGIPEVLRLLAMCGESAVPLRVWPFDGLDYSSYEDAHILVEPYPSMFREPGDQQTNEGDALVPATVIAAAVRSGDFSRWLDLRNLREDEKEIVSIEGWLIGLTQ